MVLLHLFLAFSSVEVSSIQAYVGSEVPRTQGGAYVLRAFSLDKKDFFLEAKNEGLVEALLWYPSGKVYARLKEGTTRYLGQGNPTSLSSNQQIVSFYLPTNIRVRVRENTKADRNADKYKTRTVTYRAIITTPDGSDNFFESTQTQILQDKTWVTP